MRRRLTTAFLTSCLALGVPGGLEGGYKPELRFERLGLKDGLPDTSVTEILQDRLGFLWLGTPNGLVRYDGYELFTYKPDPEDPASLSGRFVSALFEDRAGDLWIGTRRGGLNRFDRSTGRFIRYQHDPEDPASLSSDTVSAIGEDTEGALWIGTGGYEVASTGGGLNRLDPATGILTRYRHDPEDSGSLSHDNVATIHRDREGRMWIASPYGGLNRFDSATGTFTRWRHDADDRKSLPIDHLTDLSESGDGSLWIGTWGRGVVRFDPEAGTFESFRHDPEDPGSLASNDVTAIHEDSSGGVWVGAWNASLCRIDPATGIVERYEHRPADPSSPSDSNGVDAIFEDRSGILWFGTWGGGLDKLDRLAGKFIHFGHDPADPENSLVHRRVQVIERGRSGSYWIGTEGGIDVYRPPTDDLVTYKHDPEDPESLSDDMVWAIHADRSGVVWVGTQNGGLNRFDPATGRFTHFRSDRRDRSSLSRNWVMAILEDSSGELWVGTGGGGLSRLDRRSGEFTHFRYDPEDPGSLAHNFVLTLHEDRQGTLWVGAEGGGLSRFDRETGAFTRYAAPLYGLDTVNAIYEDTAGRFWVGTRNGGLHLFDRASGTSEALTMEDGLAQDTVLSILDDGSGHLWLSTGGGVSRFNPETGHFRNFGTKDGLRGQLRRGAAIAPDGQLLFASTDGLSVLNPSQAKGNPNPPAVALTDFKVFNKSVQPGPESPLAAEVSVAREITVTHRQNVVTFEFAALHFGHSPSNRYAYRLDDFNRDWSEVDASSRQATYTNLAPGSYTFRVKAANADGLWGDQEARVDLRVLPPWWRTWWAFAGYGVVLLALVVSADRFQRSRLVRREREESARREARLRTEAAELQARAAEAQAQALQAENDRKSQQLEEARRMQLSMLPESVPWHPGVEIAAYMRTATEVGGDFYDFDLDDDGILTVAIGDATGHGTRAGALVSATKSLFHLLAREEDVAEVLRKSTRALHSMRLPRRLFMALALAKWKDGVLDISSAGMPPTYVFRAGTGEVEEIVLPGMPLGSDVRFAYRKASVRLEPRDTVVFLSDGFAEMQGENGDPLGYERVLEAVRAAGTGSPQEVIDHFLATAESWSNGLPQADDMTFVVMRVREDPGAGDEERRS